MSFLRAWACGCCGVAVGVRCGTPHPPSVNVRGRTCVLEKCPPRPYLSSTSITWTWNRGSPGFTIRGLGTAGHVEFMDGCAGKWGGSRTNKKDVKLLGCQTLPFCCCKFQHCWQVRLQLSPGSAARVEPRGLYTRRWPVTLASDAGRMLPAPLANLASGPSILPLSGYIADRDLPTSLAKVASAAGKSYQRRWQMPASPASATGQRRRPASLASVTCLI